MESSLEVGSKPQFPEAQKLHQKENTVDIVKLGKDLDVLFSASEAILPLLLVAVLQYIRLLIFRRYFYVVGFSMKS